MIEQPTLSTIKEIALGDGEFENKLLSIIKRELPAEIELYQQNYANKDYLLVAGNVHKLNHKISILGLKEGNLKAVKFENELRDGNCGLKKEFDGLLEKMTQFLNDI
jgi:HPt (histidine-containing phosphotransfer) domain-containing protein